MNCPGYIIREFGIIDRCSYLMKQQVDYMMKLRTDGTANIHLYVYKRVPCKKNGHTIYPTMFDDISWRLKNGIFIE